VHCYVISNVVEAPVYALAKNIALRPVNLDDARFIVELRLDTDKNRFISESVATVEEQKKWISDYLTRSEAQLESYFIIQDVSGQALGTVRMYDYRDNSFCWGSWILRKGAPRYAAIESALSVYEIAFRFLDFTESHFDVRRQNKKVVDFHLRMGANIVEESEMDFYFKYYQEDYEKIRRKYKKFLIDSGC